MNLKGTTEETAAILKAGVRKYQGFTFEQTFRAQGIFRSGRKRLKKAADVTAGIRARTEKVDRAIGEMRARIAGAMLGKVQANWGLSSSRATQGRALAGEG